MEKPIFVIKQGAETCVVKFLPCAHKGYTTLGKTPTGVCSELCLSETYCAQGWQLSRYPSHLETRWFFTPLGCTTHHSWYPVPRLLPEQELAREGEDPYEDTTRHLNQLHAALHRRRPVIPRSFQGQAPSPLPGATGPQRPCLLPAPGSPAPALHHCSQALRLLASVP